MDVRAIIAWFAGFAARHAITIIVASRRASRATWETSECDCQICERASQEDER